MLALFTDFGLEGPYTGQVKAVLHARAPGVPVVDLCADAPMFDPMLSAYLLAAYGPTLPTGTVIVAVVDPGVGSARGTLMLEADGRWYVGPDNGLMAMVARRAESARVFPLFAPDREGPAAISASFHGRDLFAPSAARLARGERPDPADARPAALADRADWPDDLDRVIYIDRYANVMTGLRAARLPPACDLVAGDRPAARARTFADVPTGGLLWYENANGLAEVAVNAGRAADVLGARPGDAVGVRAARGR